MHSEVEKLVERIAHLRGQIVDATGPLRPVDRLRLYADEPGDWEFSPDDAETVVELLDNLGHATREAASLIERLYRERDELRSAVRKAVQLAEVASDWNLDEVEIDEKMVRTHDLRRELLRVLAGEDVQG